MAKSNTTTVKIYKSNKVFRTGVHAKSKSSKLKKSKNYKKAYRAQGR